MVISEPYSEVREGHRVPTGQGLSIAADMGLLLAQLLIRASEGKIRWVLLREPEDALSLNAPVLFGTVPRLYLDPLRGMITEARAIVAGNMKTFKPKAFSVWLGRLLT
jgi:hypothetical protein